MLLPAGASQEYTVSYSVVNPRPAAYPYVCVEATVPNCQSNQDSTCRLLESGLRVFGIYPMPASGMVNVDYLTPEDGIVSFELYDMLGRRLTVCSKM